MITKLSLQILMLLFLLSVFHSGAQEVSFQKTFRYSKFSEPGQIIVCRDQGYLMVGSVLDPATSDWDMYAVKTSSKGKVLWQKKYGIPTQQDKARAIVQLSDSSYIVGGHSKYTKLDKKGNIILAKAFNTNEFNLQHLREVKGEGIIAHGYYNWMNPARTGVALMMLDTSLNVKWAKYYENIEPGNVRGAFTILNDNGYLLAYGNGAAEYGNLTIVKTDNNGNYQWGKVIGGNAGLINLRVYDAVTLANGDFIISGNIKSSKAPVLVKFNSSGEVLWTNTYFSFFSISEYVGINKNTNDEIVFCCVGKTKDKGNDAYLTKIEADGRVKWSKAYGSKIFDAPIDFKIVKDSSYVILASHSDTTKNDFYLIKTGFDGRAPCNEKDVQIDAVPAKFTFLKDIKVETSSVSGLAGTPLNFKQEDAGSYFDLCFPEY